MVARAAQWNPSVFRKKGCLPTVEVVKEFTKLAIKCGNNFSNTKYIMCKMIRDTARNELGQNLTATKTFEEMCNYLDLNEFHENHLEQLELKRKEIEENGDGPPSKRLKPNSDGVIEMDVIFNKNLYPRTNNPKTVLHSYLKQQYMDLPVYDTVTRPSDRVFKCVMTVDGKKYAPILWSKGKKIAEQAAAIVFLNVHGMHDGRTRNTST